MGEVNVIKTDMNTASLKRYHSPLRRAQAEETRQRLLRAAAELLERHPDRPLAFAELAAVAGVQERTVYRHFPSREALLDTFWDWINERAGFTTFPASEHDLVEQPKTVFAGFDRVEGIVRASLSSAAGREMRMRRLAERRAAFNRSLADAMDGLPQARARHVAAVIQLLYSAPAWQAMKDFAGLTGAEAGEAAAWAIQTLLLAARQEAVAAGRSDPDRSDEEQP